jgi:hypothetical protein
MRLAFALLVCTVIGSAGCWRDSAVPVAEPTPTPEPSVSAAPTRSACRELGEHVATLVQTAEEPSLAAHADQLSRILERRCATDGWSVELKTCLTTAETLDAAERCEQFATDEQRHTLDDDLAGLGGED